MDENPFAVFQREFPRQLVASLDRIYEQVDRLHRPDAYVDDWAGGQVKWPRRRIRIR